jgi:ATP-dependent RNA helicase RhlE
MNFEQFNLHRRVLAGAASEKYLSPTPIQEKAIPAVMGGRDVIGLAQTGTGKTAAFMLPILNRLMTGGLGRPRALVIAPTRELAEQIHQSTLALGRHTRSRSVTAYGGVGIGPQITRLRKGVEIVIGCPGRILDHIDRGTIDLGGIEIVVLDEADHMFDMGFLPDIKRILRALPANRQNLLFSATMPSEIRALAGEMLDDPVEIRIGATAPADSVHHALFPVAQNQKTDLLMSLLRKTDFRSVLVFTRTKHRAKRLGEKLSRAGYTAASIRGDLSQNRRREAMDGFRDGRFRILVATDIAARGIDVTKVSHVINFDIPGTPEAYIHRIGRTGRASQKGEAFTLITSEDKAMVRAIDRMLGFSVERRQLKGLETSFKAEPADSPRAASEPKKSGYRPWKGKRRKSRAPA